MSERFDAIVIGVGAMGSAACYELARRGKRVLGLERFDILHEMGSSHGITRVIRMAYSEGPQYVPLLQRAYVLWEELQRRAGEPLLHLNGCINASPPEGTIFRDALRAARAYDLPCEVLTGSELNRRFAAFQIPANSMALLEPMGGFLAAERCIVAQVEAAQSHGAEIHAREPLVAWEPHNEGVHVRSQHAVYEADRLVITTGAWAGDVVDCLSGLVAAERQVLAWFQPRRPELFMPDRLPVFQVDIGGRYYGMPVFGIPGLKIGLYHHRNEQVDPDAVDRLAHDADEAILREFVDQFMPEGSGPLMAMKVCLFENSPDEHFIVDIHPDHPQVAFAAGLSGHGFKFAPVIGEILADLAESGSTKHDISRFQLSRFRSAAAVR
jgi:sarcosine oxidase